MAGWTPCTQTLCLCEYGKEGWAGVGRGGGLASASRSPLTLIHTTHTHSSKKGWREGWGDRYWSSTHKHTHTAIRTLKNTSTNKHAPLHMHIHTLSTWKTHKTSEGWEYTDGLKGRKSQRRDGYPSDRWTDGCREWWTSLTFFQRNECTSRKTDDERVVWLLTEKDSQPFIQLTQKEEGEGMERAGEKQTESVFAVVNTACSPCALSIGLW